MTIHMCRLSKNDMVILQKFCSESTGCFFLNTVGLTSTSGHIVRPGHTLGIVSSQFNSLDWIIFIQFSGIPGEFGFITIESFHNVMIRLGSWRY